MSENQTIKSRLMLYIESLGISTRQFERVCGMANGYINNMRQSLSPAKMQSIAQHYPNLNMGWLMTGEGGMLRDGGHVVQNNRNGDNIHGNNVNVDKSEAALLELLKKKDEQIDKLLDIIGRMNG